MYMCWVSILQKIWLVITYYGTSSASPPPQPRIGKIPSLAPSGRCNIETNYGWNWKATSLFRLDQTTAKRISAEVEIPPKCFLLHYHHWHLRHSQLPALAVDINIYIFRAGRTHEPTEVGRATKKCAISLGLLGYTNKGVQLMNFFVKK